MLAKLFNNNNARKGLFNLMSNYNLISTRNLNLNGLLSYQKYSLSTFNDKNNFDLLDKEINQVKKLNSEFKTNKNLIKKRLNKEKYMNNTPHVNTEEISQKIEEIKNKKRSDLDSETQKIPESFKSFFDDSAFDGEPLLKENKDKGTKFTEKGLNLKQKVSEPELNLNAGKKVKLDDIGENVDLDAIERKILNHGKTTDNNANQKKYRENYIERGKDSGKPYKNFGNNNIKSRSKFDQDEHDKNPNSGYDNKRTYAK